MSRIKRRVTVQYGTIPLAELLESAEPAAGGNAVIRDEKGNLAVCAFRRADHAAAFQTAELDRLEVDYCGNLLADQFFRLVPFRDSGNDLSFLIAEIQLEDQQFIGTWMLFTADDLSNLYFKLFKVFNCDFILMLDCRLVQICVDPGQYFFGIQSGKQRLDISSYLVVVFQLTELLN